MNEEEHLCSTFVEAVGLVYTDSFMYVLSTEINNDLLTYYTRYRIIRNKL